MNQTLETAHSPPETTHSAVLGRVLAQKRKEMGMDQAEISKQSGINRSTWSRWENGLAVPNTIQLTKICKVLKTTPHDFLAKVQNISKELEEGGVQVNLEKNPLNMEQNPPKTDNKFGLFILGAALGAIITTIMAKSDDKSDKK